MDGKKVRTPRKKRENESQENRNRIGQKRKIEREKKSNFIKLLSDKIKFWKTQRYREVVFLFEAFYKGVLPFNGSITLGVVQMLCLASNFLCKQINQYILKSAV